MGVQLSPKQALSIAQATAPMNVWDGAVSSGKTIASLIAWADYVANAPPGNLLMVGKTRDTIQRNCIDPLQNDLFPDHPSAVQFTAGAPSGRFMGRKVYVVGANDRKAQSRIQGITLAGSYVDEASLLPPGYWPMLETRLRVPGARLFATTNPDSPAHWLKRDVLDRADELGVRHWHFVIADNPGLDPAYVARLERSLTGLFRRRYLLGEWVAAEGAIYDMLDLTGRHRATWDDLRDHQGRLLLTGRYFVAADYGTTNPSHAVLLALGNDGRLYVAGEWRHDSRKAHRQLTDAEQSLAVRQWLAHGCGIPGLEETELLAERLAVDPSAASFRLQLRRDGVHGVTEANNAVLDGIRVTGSLLSQDRLRFIEGAAPELERELGGYVWDDDKAEKGEDVPLKVDDHGPDALRYGVMAARSVWRHWLADLDVREQPEPEPEEEVELGRYRPLRERMRARQSA